MSQPPSSTSTHRTPASNEPAGQEAALAKRRVAVRRAEFLRLLADVERLQADAAQQPDGVLVHLVVGLDLLPLVGLLEVAADPVGPTQLG
jgi:hypothetical protein